MSDSSPKWKRPSDVMVMRKRRKPVRSSTQSTKENLKSSQPEKTAIGHLTRKRSNPFGCSPSKRRNNNKSGLVSLADEVKPVLEKNDDAEYKSGVLWDMLCGTESNEVIKFDVFPALHPPDIFTLYSGICWYNPVACDILKTCNFSEQWQASGNDERYFRDGKGRYYRHRSQIRNSTKTSNRRAHKPTAWATSGWWYIRRGHIIKAAASRLEFMHKNEVHCARNIWLVLRTHLNGWGNGSCRLHSVPETPHLCPWSGMTKAIKINYHFTQCLISWLFPLQNAIIFKTRVWGKAHGFDHWQPVRGESGPGYRGLPCGAPC